MNKIKEKIIKKVTKNNGIITTEVKKENPAEKNSTGTRMIQTKECIILQML